MVRIELDFLDPRESDEITNWDSWETKDFEDEQQADDFIERNNIKCYKPWRYVFCEECGEKVYLTDGFANTCDCGAEYNVFGQRLAPRSQWGWETGERF